MTDATRYPLSWPHGWKRTPARERSRGTFQTSKRERHGETVNGQPATITIRAQRITVPDAVKRLSAELDRLGATATLLSTNLQTRLDGLPRGGQTEPADPGAAVYFRLKGKPRCLACDKWDRVADNIAAIAQHIDALRRIERYGVGTMEQAFAGYAALPPSAEHNWWLVLGVSPDATPDQIDAAFRAKARTAHPDVGGSHTEMARLNMARDAALAEVLV